MKKLIKILVCIIIISIIWALIVLNVSKKENKNTDNTLTIGLDDSFPPMGFRNDSNEIVGFDIDLAKTIGNEIGMNVDFQPISWAEKEQELDSGKIDCIWNGFAYTEERTKIMTLSDVYVKGEMYFILKNGSKIKSQEELKGKKIGVQNGSVQQVDLENSELGKEIEILKYGDFLTAFMDLDAGGIDAVFCSSITGNYLITSLNKNYNTIPSKNISTASGSVIAFKKGNIELKDRIQNAFNKLLNEGKLDDISIKWFGTDMFCRKENT